ncbi:MAG: hypothetical protein K6A92_07305 [Lachnospiraceae bacterium]|nr:hypothetical protein [Lachnospiraceae bacterium]
MENLIFIACFAGVLLLLFLAGIRQNKREDEELKKAFRASFGKSVTDREEGKKGGKGEDFLQNVTTYYDHHPVAYKVDDITWNDLDLDRIFHIMDQTGSSAGASCLYHLLRVPVYTKEELTERDKKLLALTRDEKSRVLLQLLFHKIGKSGKYALYDYIGNLGDTFFTPAYVYYAYLSIYVMLIILSVVLPAAGLPALAIWAAFRVSGYLKEKNKIAPYLSCFGYILRMLKQGREVEKLLSSGGEVKDAFSAESHQLSSLLKDFSSFEKGAYLVTSMNSSTGRGNPIDLLLDFVRMLFAPDLIKAGQMVRILKNRQDELDALYTVLGMLDAYISLASFREGLPQTATPVYTKERKIVARNLYHPLIKDAVPNDFSMEPPYYGTLITGSNASGKSTFLKAMALSLLFGQIFYRACASYLETMPACVFTSMSLKDSILEGESYYMAEIRSIKRMISVDTQDAPGLPVCFVDEVLRGTNTVERIAASSQILRSFANKQFPSIVATHDLELAGLLKDVYANLHFEEQFGGDDVVFPYKLIKGVSDTQNAIRLLQQLGFDAELTDKAQELADIYRKEEKWPEVTV